MKPHSQPEIQNHLSLLRQRRGVSAAGLAKMVGVTRQTIYAIEAGTYVPNTAVALRLARALEVTLEELFTLQPPETPAVRTEQAFLLPGSEKVQTGQPVQLCQVDKRLLAVAPSTVPWCLPPTDALADGKAPDGKVKLRLYHADGEFRNRLLVAGCDPAISVLARHVQAAGIELVLVHRNSSQALQLLKDGNVHIAGTHLRDEASGESNLPEISRRFPRNAIAVFSFAVWEEGLVTARGNPKQIRGVADLARKDVSLVNREKGAGSRRLLDAHLAQLGLDAKQIRGYDCLAAGHLAAAWQVLSGAGDCCIATRAAARVYGLAFIPLVSERYDLAIRRQHLDLPAMQAVMDALNRASFRRELEGIGGYDAKTAGLRML